MTSSVLTEIERAVGAAVAAHGASVVGVGEGPRAGSGFVVRAGRALVDARRISGEEVEVSFEDGATRPGAVRAVDAELGLAVVEVDTAQLEPLAWGDVSPAPGAPVIALAKPGGRGLRASLGFVLASGRRIRGRHGRALDGVLEHSAALPRGAAGGPLLTADGALAGINVLRAEGGLILALGTPLRERVERVLRGERSESPPLGVAVAPPRVARRLQRALGLAERDGILVRAVQDDTPAAAAGLERGDLIVAAAGSELAGIDALHAAIDEARGRLELAVVRGTEERTVEVDLGARS